MHLQLFVRGVGARTHVSRGNLLFVCYIAAHPSPLLTRVNSSASCKFVFLRHPGLYFLYRYVRDLQEAFHINKVRINLPLFSTVVPPSIFMFLSCRPFVAITTLSTGLVGVEVTSVSWLG